MGINPENYTVEGAVKGKDLIGKRVSSPFHELPAHAGVDCRVVAWDGVGSEEGTGVVHIAPGCGAEDFELGKEKNLSVFAPIDESGNYTEGFGDLTGKNAAAVSQEVFDSLKSKGLLYSIYDYTHRYPLCWRCREELVFRLVEEWFILTDEIRPLLREANEKVRWLPSFLGKRMDDWLVNMGDWCISRKRFWGLPLPFYSCRCGHVTIVGSRKELSELWVEGSSPPPELHKPWLDEIKIKCPACGKPVERIPEVGDCWLDAGIVPFSTLHYMDEDNRNYFETWYPFELVCEMREQVRLWFYSLLFMSVALENKPPYESVFTYEKLLDEDGKEMHKSLGNTIWFDDAVEKMGADVMRWLYAAQNVSTNLRFGFTVGREIRRKLLTLWNVYSFFVTYARLDKPDLSGKAEKEHMTELDLWVKARLRQLVLKCTEAMDGYDIASVTTRVEEFVEDLSNWYVRRSRKRFWKAEDDADKRTAYRTLYEAIVTITKIIAPILPFMAEAIYRNMTPEEDLEKAESVHLCPYPEADGAAVDRDLIERMEKIRAFAALGHAARNEKGIKVRQPLRTIYLKATEKEWEKLRVLFPLLVEELNIKEVERAEDPGKMDRDRFALFSDEAGRTVLLDTEITDELRKEGIAREFIRKVQILRRETGLNVEDRIELLYKADEPFRSALAAHRDWIAGEILAVKLGEAEPADGWSEVKMEGKKLKVSLKKAS